MKITKEQLSKAFKLSDSFGPTHNGLQVLKAVSRTQGGFYIVLKRTEMKMYPVKSYGKKDTTYLIYSSVFDRNNDLEVTYQLRCTSLKNAMLAIISLNEV